MADQSGAPETPVALRGNAFDQEEEEEEEEDMAIKKNNKICV